MEDKGEDTRKPTSFDDLLFHFGRDVAAHYREVPPHAVPKALDVGVYLGHLGVSLSSGAQRAEQRSLG